MTRTLLLAGALAASVAAASAAAAPAREFDRATVAAIKDEGLHRSQVMELAGWLSDVYGPRLTGSPTMEAAGRWAQQQLREWGVENVREERFPFGAGWSLERFHAQMVEPGVMPIIGYPKALDQQHGRHRDGRGRTRRHPVGGRFRHVPRQAARRHRAAAAGAHRADARRQPRAAHG